VKTGENAAVEWGLERPAEADGAGENLLTYKDVQARLKLSRRSVVSLANSGRLPRLRLLGAVRFHPDDVRALIETSRV
jgi:predicted DNA-binding transcriptional regulator AlpA